MFGRVDVVLCGAIMSVVFCVICSLLKFVSNTSGGNLHEHGSCYGFVCCKYCLVEHQF